MITYLFISVPESKSSVEIYRKILMCMYMYVNRVYIKGLSDFYFAEK